MQSDCLSRPRSILSVTREWSTEIQKKKNKKKKCKYHDVFMYIQQLKCKTNPRMIMINKACGAPDKMKYSDLLVIGFLTSCQPHRVTSGRSNSVISKCTFKHASHIYSQVKIYQINPYTNIKQNTQTSNRHFQIDSSFKIPLVKN